MPSGTLVTTASVLSGSGKVSLLSLAWTATAGGAVSQTFTMPAGTIILCEVIPGAGTPPTAGYTVTVADPAGVNLLTDGAGGTISGLVPGSPNSGNALATGVQQQNTHSYPVQVVIAANGATITAVVVNGFTVGVAAGTYTVPAYGGISISYTVATPTWVWTSAAGNTGLSATLATAMVPFYPDTAASGNAPAPMWTPGGTSTLTIAAAGSGGQGTVNLYMTAVRV